MSRGTQGTRRSQHDVVYGAVTLYGRSFQTFRLPHWFVTPCDGPYNPAVHARRFGLFRVRSPLLAESLLFSVPPGTEMVHFPGLSSTGLCIQQGMTQKGRVSPFRDLRIKAYLPAPRSFSQAITSFVACNRQGIHHMHLFA